MSLGDIYKLSVIGRTPAQAQLVTSFHYRATQDTIVDTQTEDLIQAFYGGGTAAVWTAFESTCGNSIGLDRLEARQVSSPALEFAELNITEVGTGGAGDHLPPQCSAVISWRTGNIGRSFRGRNYMFPSLEGNQAAGQWTGGYLTVLSNFADAAMEIGDGLATAIYELVIWSTVANGVPRVPPIATLVTSHKEPIFVHTQRRRVTGVGA